MFVAGGRLEFVALGLLVPCLDDELPVVGEQPERDRGRSRGWQGLRRFEGVGEQFAGDQDSVVDEGGEPPFGQDVADVVASAADGGGQGTELEVAG